jgi:hypothetical protein
LIAPKVHLRIHVETQRCKPDRSLVGDVVHSEVSFEWTHWWSPQVGDMLRVECDGPRRWRVIGREFVAGGFVLRVAESIEVPA